MIEVLGIHVGDDDGGGAKTRKRAVAFVSLGAGKFEPREVRMGVQAEDGMVEILSGLRPGELVVTSGQFLLDSEARIREALGKMIRGELASEQERAAVLAGRTTIRELIGVLACAAALVSNDTGPAHLGAALGVATVTVFGPTERFATEPIGPRARAVDHPVECAPCMLRDCPIDHRCMTGVEVGAVLEAVEAAMR